MVEVERPGIKVGQSQEEFMERVIWPSVRTRKVLEAMSKVDRLLFAQDAEEDFLQLAYSDYVIPLGDGSSLSQPSLVAEMIEHLDLDGRKKVLEIGTGSGYSSAVLSHISPWVDTIEFNKELADHASERLNRLGYTNVRVHNGDGAQGLPHEAPFGAIIVTAGVKAIPYQLEKQLEEGGRIVAPVGDHPDDLKLVVAQKINGTLTTKAVHDAFFVPLVSRFHGGFDPDENFERPSIKDRVEFSLPRAARYLARKLNIDEDEFLELFESSLSYDGMKEQEDVDKMNALLNKLDCLLSKVDGLKSA